MTTPDTIRVETGCKVNLHLAITGRLDNGYHTLGSLFVHLPSPSDTLTLEFGSQGGELRIKAGDPELETESNTIAKAWRLFARHTGFAPALTVTLQKRVPMGAGLGGGSADAAAVLTALNERAGSRALSQDKLLEIAATVGADVPFFLKGKTAWAEGIGDRLEPMDIDFTGLCLVLVCPDVHVSSAWAYTAWDESNQRPPRRLENTRGFLTCDPDQFKSTPCLRLLLLNDFEDVVFPEHPILREYKEKLLSSGACGAVMSGSGASLAALFRDRNCAKKVVQMFEEEGIPVFLHCF